MNVSVNTGFFQNKKSKNKNNGDNINQNIDIPTVVDRFINYYYNTITTTPIKLAHDKVIREYSAIKYQGKKLQGDDFIQLIQSMYSENITYNSINMDFIDSGSRRIDISVVGTIICNEPGKHVWQKNFSQTFLLSHNKDGWFIKNSILIII